MSSLGFDCSYIDCASKKYSFKLFKIFGLCAHQATIIKQCALSVGTDAAVHRDVLMCKIESSDVLVAGSVSQLFALSQKLKKQPFSLSKLAEDLLLQLTMELVPLKIRENIFDWNKKTYIMGILNVTPDSFSDGGCWFEKDAALSHARKIIETSDILDLGAESTRPGALAICADEEIKRLIPILKSIREFDSNFPISIDTRNSKTAKAALEAGADIINDVSGLEWDKQMVDVIKDFDAPVVLMHSLPHEINMSQVPYYEGGVVNEVFKNLSKKIDFALSRGIKKKNIIIDVGIGFDKTFENNLELIRRMDEFLSLGCALLAGVSRKSVIKKIVGENLESLDDGTLALSAYLASKKINILRVHNTSVHRSSIDLIDELVRR